jgi:hypothetical protein
MSEKTILSVLSHPFIVTLGATFQGKLHEKSTSVIRKSNDQTLGICTWRSSTLWAASSLHIFEKRADLSTKCLDSTPRK